MLPYVTHSELRVPDMVSNAIVRVRYAKREAQTAKRVFVEVWVREAQTSR